MRSKNIPAISVVAGDSDSAIVESSLPHYSPFVKSFLAASLGCHKVVQKFSQPSD